MLPPKDLCIDTPLQRTTLLALPHSTRTQPPPAWHHAFEHAVHFVRLAARLAHLGDEHVTVLPAPEVGEARVRLPWDRLVAVKLARGGQLERDEQVFAGVAVRRESDWVSAPHCCLPDASASLEPMPCPPRAHQPTQLVDLDPDNLVDTAIPPQREQLAPELHRAAGHPDGEERPRRLERRDRERAAVVVGEGAVGELRGHSRISASERREQMRKDPSRTLMCMSHGGSIRMSWNL